MALSIGIAVTPLADRYPEIISQVLAAELGGLDLVGIQDHPYQRRFLDTFALIGDLLARTRRLRFFPDVASLPMRPPTMLAKAAVSLDRMSGGRFELGLGAGAFWDAVKGMGGGWRAPGERIDALAEAILLVRAALDVGPEKRVVRGPGPHHPVPGYPAGPPPAHRVQIWVGAMAPRSLALVGRLADGWIPASGIERIAEFGALGARIDEAALAAGRDPAAIRRIVNVGSVTSRAEPEADLLLGPADRLVETLAAWALEHRIDAFVVWPPEAEPHFIERLGAEIAPALREAVGAGGPAAAV